MKKKNVLILSLVALSLIGCDQNSNTNSNENKTSDKVVDSSTKKDTTNSSKKDDTTKKDSTSKDTTSKDGDDDDDSLWPSEIKKVMKKYFDMVLPYVEISSRPSNLKNKYTYSSNTLTIMGDVVSGDISDKLNSGKDTYTSAGFDASVENNKMTATNKAGDITVIFYSDDGILTFKAVYTETFNPEVRDSWDDDLISELNSKYHNHASDIPYVYLGAKNVTYNLGSESGSIIGNIWDDSIIDLAKTAFEERNKTITNDANKWNTEIKTTNKLSTLIANITLEDGCKIKIYVERNRTSMTKINPRMRIIYNEPFTIPTGDDAKWTDDIKLVFENNFDKHYVPYFYCGSLNPTINDSTTTSITITANENSWDSRVIALAEAAFADENSTITNEENKWKVTKSGSTANKNYKLVAKRTYDDNCSIEVTVENWGYDINKPEIHMNYTPGYKAPTGEYAKWSETVTDAFLDHLNNNTIPYVYLNTTSEDVKWNDQSSKLTITGGTYNVNVLSYADTAFKADSSWTGSIQTLTERDDEGTYSWTGYRAEKILNSSTGEKLTVIVTGSELHTNDNSISGNCKMDIIYSKPYSIPTGDDASWSDDISTFIYNHLGGHTIPFVYLNYKTLQTDYDDNYIKLTGGLWNSIILNQQLDDWNTTVSDDKLTGNKTFDDNCTLNLTVYENDQGLAELRVDFIEGFDTTLDSWSKNIETQMKSCLNNNVLDFINLGTPVPEVETNVSNHNFTLTTHIWNDSIINSAKSFATEENGWTLLENVSASYANRIDAFKFNSDGSILYFNLYKTRSGTTLNIYYYESEDLTSYTKDSWTDSETAYLNSLSNNHADDIPYLYMGEGEYSQKSGTSSYLEGSSSSLVSMFKYVSKLKQSGYTITSFNAFSYCCNIEATKTESDGTTITIETYTPNSTKLTQLFVSCTTNSNI